MNPFVAQRDSSLCQLFCLLPVSPYTCFLVSKVFEILSEIHIVTFYLVVLLLQLLEG